MGGYAVTEFVEYKVNDAMKTVLRAMYPSHLEPEAFMVDASYKLAPGPLRAIVFYGGFQNLFKRLSPEEAEKIWGLTDKPFSGATVRQSYNMTILRSRILDSTLIYEPI